MADDRALMGRAIELALLAEQEGNLPVGAVIVLDGQIVAEGRSALWVPRFDGTRHAEVEALRAVPARLWGESPRMRLYTTLEPCLMCFGAIMLHRVGKVVFGSPDDYGGASAVFAQLPPYFRDRLREVEWSGPLMPAECDPLYARVMAAVEARERHDGVGRDAVS